MLNQIISENQKTQILQHFPSLSGRIKIVHQTSTPSDETLVKRIIRAYGAAADTNVGQTDSIWLREFELMNKEAHKTLRSGSLDPVTRLLRNPAESMLFFGFESIQAKDAAQNQDPTWVKWQHTLCYDNLLQLGAATGLFRAQNPEAPPNIQRFPEVEDILSALGPVFGFTIDFPNLFPEEIGLETTRGVANYRAIQALYQAWRIRQYTSGTDRASVCEIGGGLGRTAYYANRMGIRDYTIIDLPLTGVSQAYFLGRTLGEENICLYDESRQEGKTKILPPMGFHRDSGQFDLIVNFDSMTEMAEETAQQYLRTITQRSSRFLSINHEANRFTVAELLGKLPNIGTSRNLCWSRRGYVEEYVEIFESTP